MELGSKIKKFMSEEAGRFLILLTFVSGVAALFSYDGEVRSYNTTMLALSYQYGFTSRSLLGTIYHLLNLVTPFDMINYRCVLIFAHIITALFVLFLLRFDYVIVKKCSEKAVRAVESLLVIFNIVVISNFYGAHNFLRVDMFMIWCTLAALLVILAGKGEWLVIPLSALGVMFHQGYVFMYFSPILVMLLYEAFARRERTRKYLALFGTSFVTDSALFLWFEFFSRTNGEKIYDRITAEASALSLRGYHATLLLHEVLGIDLSDSETLMAQINSVQIWVFLILLSPYLILLFLFARRTFAMADGKWEKLKYFFVFFGMVTIIPNFILKVDYGRWTLAVVTYYLVMICCLNAQGDVCIQAATEEFFRYFRQKPYLIFVLILPALMVPLWDVDINGFVQHVAEWLNFRFLHVFTY